MVRAVNPTLYHIIFREMSKFLKFKIPSLYSKADDIQKWVVMAQGGYIFLTLGFSIKIINHGYLIYTVNV